MRTLMIPLLMAALTATASKPEKMFVVVHTTDGVVEDYVCTTLSGTNDAYVVRSQIRSVGRMIWHVTGGVAPYTVVEDNSRGPYGGCVTVIDAEGNRATGCGVVGQRRITVPVQCPGMSEDSLMYKSKVHAPKPDENEDGTILAPPPPTTDPVKPFDPTSTKDPIGPDKGPVTMDPIDYYPPIKVFSPVTSAPPPPPPPTPNGHTGTYPVTHHKEHVKPGGNNSPVHTGSSRTTSAPISRSGPVTSGGGSGSGGNYHTATKQPSQAPR